MASLLRQSHLNFLRPNASSKTKAPHSDNSLNSAEINQSDYLSNIRKHILMDDSAYLDSHIASPSDSYHSSSKQKHAHKYKQVARIICHIRDEIYSEYPQIIMPTRRMIECLVYNAFEERTEDKSSDNEDWYQLVIETLKNLRDLTDASLNEGNTEGYCHFTETDGVTRLFPSYELFDEWDAHKFSQTLLYHLNKELN